MIKAEIVGHSLSPQGEELISVLCTFPRIILAEVNTHRMLSKNTSSSRAIPFKKMVESVETNPFIPIAWQKEHKGMQGSEYLIDPDSIADAKSVWLMASSEAVFQAKLLNKNEGVTKQLCNRLLEPFMWTTMLITGSRQGWDNFFNLRCPIYESHKGIQYKSWKDYRKDSSLFVGEELKTYSQIEILEKNKGQAEIHMMDLAEKIWDAVGNSIPKQLKAGEWHIPFGDRISFVGNLTKSIDEQNTYWKDYDEQNKVKISIALGARTSYTVVGDEKDIDYEKMIELHDRLLSQDPPHSSPLEHCAKAMNEEDYDSFIKGECVPIYNKEAVKVYPDDNSFGWCNNFKGFIPYRYLVDNKFLSL